MKNHKICMKLLTLLLCAAMTFATPLTVLAGEEPEHPFEMSEGSSPECEVYVFEVDLPAEQPQSETPAQTPETPVVTPEQPQAETPAQTPETPVETPEQSQAETLVQTPETPAETPEQPQAETPALSEDETPEEEESEVSEQQEAQTPDAEGESLSEDELENSTEGTGKEKETDEGYTDAEKYYEKGYDKSLCWAATAANMLWDANYAQQAVNPFTNEKFKSEDEVFDFFRKCFNDQGASPDIAIEYFIDGTKKIADKKGYDKLFRDDAPAGGFLKGALSDDDIKMISSQKMDPFYVLNDLNDSTGGLLIRWWLAEEFKFTSNAHWLTIVSVDKDQNGNYTGVWLADSDNDVATRAGKKGSTPEEKARLASEMPNSLTHYDVVHEIVNYKNYWVVVDFSKMHKAVIWFVCTLANNDFIEDAEDPEEWDEWEESDEPNDTENEDDWDEWEDIDDEDDDDYDDDDNKHELPEDIEQRIREIIEKDMSDDDTDDDDNNIDNTNDNSQNPVDNADLVEIIVLDYDMISEGMAENNIESFSLSNGVFVRSANTAYRMIVRRDPSALKSVYIDGNIISDYSINDLSNGSFELSLGSSLLSTLAPGTHTLKIEFNGGDDIVTMFEVK